jgi:uncharacterized protein (DUF1697 family)
MNCRMAELRRCVEVAGFTDVRTLLSSGNVVFSTARTAAAATLVKRIEQALREGAGYRLAIFVRSTAQLLDADPFAEAFADPALPLGSKRVITFLRQPVDGAGLTLPMAHGEACIMSQQGSEVFSRYVPGARGPAFMPLLEKLFGRDITTRTWATVVTCARA